MQISAGRISLIIDGCFFTISEELAAINRKKNEEGKRKKHRCTGFVDFEAV
jgi:hypothetical protein